MRTVLGIDAAWTLTQPSGLALVVEGGAGPTAEGGAGTAADWRLVAAESSYQRFLARADGGLGTEERPAGAAPDVPALLAAAATLGGRPVDLVAIDMPLALSPITGRRVSDNAVTRAYGGRKCGTHSPSALRPGRISDTLRAGFESAGYPLRTTAIAPPGLIPGLIEVYPHPALVELAGAPERLPYKFARIRKYWPEEVPAQRRALLLQKWEEIVDLLEGRIAGVAPALPRPDPAARGWVFKACEDALDAVVCAWVAVTALEGQAKPFGDADSAIWVPSPATA